MRRPYLPIEWIRIKAKNPTARFESAKSQGDVFVYLLTPELFSLILQGTKNSRNKNTNGGIHD
jgi:hypothetical protein